MKNSKQKIWLKITCVNVIVLSITQNYPSMLLFPKHYWVLSYLKIIGWTQSLQFSNEPTFWRQNNCSRIYCCNSWDVVTHQHSGDPAIHTFDVNADAQYVVTHQHSGDPAIVVFSVFFADIGRNSPTFWCPCNLKDMVVNYALGRNSPTFWWPCNSTTFKAFVNAVCSTLFAVDRYFS